MLNTHVVAATLVVVASVMLFVAILLAWQLIAPLPYQNLRRLWQVTALGIPILCFVGLILSSVAGPLTNAAVIVVCAISFVALASVFLWMMVLSSRSIKAMQQVYQVNGIDIYDELTRVHNRTYLEYRLDEEVSRAQRYGAPLSVMAVDIAGYYKFADEFGHHAGEIAVCKLAAKLQESLRETDVIARFRADTFVLLLPDTPKRGIRSLKQRLSNDLESLVVLEGSEQEVISVEVNFGQAYCQLSTIDGQELLTEALRALRGGAQSTLTNEFDLLPGTTGTGANPALPILQEPAAG